MKYIIGEKVIGQVINITNYGAFIRFDDEYVGLLHISEMSDKYVSDIREYAKEGNSIYVKIIDIDEEKKQMRLSIKGLNYKKIKMDAGKKRIVETSNGFRTLERKLNYWIQNYLKNKKINKYY